MLGDVRAFVALGLETKMRMMCSMVMRMCAAICVGSRAACLARRATVLQCRLPTTAMGDKLGEKKEETEEEATEGEHAEQLPRSCLKGARSAAPSCSWSTPPVQSVRFTYVEGARVRQNTEAQQLRLLYVRAFKNQRDLDRPGWCGW